MLGYGTGRHAPGLTEGEGALAAAHHLLLGHGLAVPVIRAADPSAAGGHHAEPAAGELPPLTEPEDRLAAERSLMNANLLFTDPVLAGALSGPGPGRVRADHRLRLHPTG